MKHNNPFKIILLLVNLKNKDIGDDKELVTKALVTLAILTPNIVIKRYCNDLII
jgi:hypothetical protein